MADDTVTADAPAEGSKAAQKSSPAKQHVKRTPKPDVDELKAKIRALDDTIEATKARQDAIRKELDKRRRQGGDSASNDIRRQLQELRNQFQSVLAQKKAAREELDGATKAREALRSQVRSMKTKMEYTTVEKIDEQLRRMEGQLAHTSMPLAEEKRLVENMEKLRKSRATVAQFSSQMDKLNGEDDCKAIMDRLKADDEKLTNIKTKEEELRAQLSDIRAKEDEKNADVPALQQELADGKVLIRETIATIRSLRDDHRAKQDEWWVNEQAWREQRQQERERRDAEFAAMRAEREAERRQYAKELAGDPFQKEVSMCEQLHGYLSRFQDSTKANAADKGIKEVKPLEGMNVYTKKKVEDDNPYASLQKKSKKGRKADRQKAAEPSDRKLNHDFDILEAFSQLKVEAPITSSKVPAAMEEVAERKKYWLKRQEEAKAKGDDDVVDNEQDGASAAPAGTSAKQRAPQPSQRPYDPAVAEPTPAEAAAGKAPAPSSADTPAAVDSGGAWNTSATAATTEPQHPPSEVANGGDNREGGHPNSSSGGNESDSVRLGLSHNDDGSVQLALTLNQ